MPGAYFIFPTKKQVTIILMMVSLNLDMDILISILNLTIKQENKMATEITDANFEQEVLQSKTPVLVDFWAEWCGPCKMLAPVIDDISKDMAGKLKVVKINIDNNPLVPSKLGIRGIPTMILFKDGEQLATKVGALQKSSLTEWINSNI